MTLYKLKWTINDHNKCLCVVAATFVTAAGAVAWSGAAAAAAVAVAATAAVAVAAEADTATTVLLYSQLLVYLIIQTYYSRGAQGITHRYISMGSQIGYLWPGTDASIVLSSQVNYSLIQSSVREVGGVGWMGGEGRVQGSPGTHRLVWLMYCCNIGTFYVRSSYYLWSDAQ